MDAERRRRATVAEAEGKAEAEVKIAEAEKQAAVLRAEGQAQAIETIARAERAYLESLTAAADRESACMALVAQKYIDGFREITKNPSDKVFVPNNFGAVFGFNGECGLRGGNEIPPSDGRGRSAVAHPHLSALRWSEMRGGNDGTETFAMADTRDAEFGHLADDARVNNEVPAEQAEKPLADRNRAGHGDHAI